MNINIIFLYIKIWQLLLHNRYLYNYLARVYSHDGISPLVRIFHLIILFFFLTLFKTKSLQSPGTYISKSTWDPTQKAITK